MLQLSENKNYTMKLKKLGSYALVEIALLLLVILPTIAVYKFTKE